MSRKNSKIRLLPKDELEKLVKESTSLSQVLKHFNMQNKGSNVPTLRRVLKDYNIDFSHMKRGLNSNQGRKFGFKRDIKEYLIKDCPFSRCIVKKRCLAEGILENKCAECGQLPEWQNKKLVLVLDHINGVHNDNRIENLRLLCPNCNSQTDTFAGKNNKKKL